jgi:hypothetical protein
VDQPHDLRCYTQPVNEQKIVDRIAVLAKPHLTDLLRLRSVRHIWNPTPGALNSSVIENGRSLTLDKFKRASQPYRNIERFLTDDRMMQYIVRPGLLPIVLAISKDIMGKKLLITRRVAAREDDKGVVAHLDGFGVRVIMYMDQSGGETIVEWTCFYGVL